MTGFNKIKEWLLPKLQEKGWSVEEFANACGLSRAIVYFYMADTHRPSEETMIRMCHVLNVPVEDGLAQYTPRIHGRPPVDFLRYTRKH